VIERTVYRFHELSDKAKARARDHYREQGLHDQWWDFVYEDAVRVAGILGISITEKSGPSPAIYFSGFSSQGDGASFQGGYTPKPGNETTEGIRNECPEDKELHRIADALALLQVSTRVQHGLHVEASITTSGSYCHSGTMNVDVTYVEWTDGESPDLAVHEELTQLMRDFADWIYNQLETEYDWLTSDEHIDETLLDGDNEFKESGELV
jgi:hypothetical protein